jgi:hypothetical protein
MPNRRFYMNIWGRAAEKARRLAIIYACSENALNPIITENAIKLATSLVAYTTKRMRYRSRTLEYYLWAVRNIDKISPQACRYWAQANFSVEKLLQCTRNTSKCSMMSAPMDGGQGEKTAKSWSGLVRFIPQMLQEPLPACNRFHHGQP